MTKKKTVSEYPRTRVVWFTSNVFGADGKVIITLNQVKDAIQKHSTSLKRYSVEMHDKDVHDEESIKDREARRSRLYIETYKGYAQQMGLAEDHGTPDAPNPSGYAYNATCVAKTKAYQDWLCPERKVGDPKEIHIHAVLELKSNRRLDEIARWFGLPVNLFDKVTGRHAFEDCAEYLVHAKQPEKHQYDPKTVWANFDYPEWLENQKILDIQHEKYRIGSDELNDMIQAVCDGKYNLREVKEKVSEPIYLRNKDLFQKARNEYIFNHAKMPSPRQVFYIDTTMDPKTGKSRSGFGKTICAQALAKVFAKQYMPEKKAKELLQKPISDLSDYIFSVGAKGVAWQKYDGQPVVLIDDRTGESMRSEFGGPDGVKTLLDAFPEKHSENRKYGDACVIAKYIIINGIVPADEFFSGLAGTDEPLDQFTRRVPFLVTLLTEEQIAMYFNKGVFEDTSEWEKYETIQMRKANFRRLKETVGDSQRYEIEHKILEPVEVKSLEYDTKKKDENKAQTFEEIPDDVKHYGEEVTSDIPRIITIGESKTSDNKIWHPARWDYNLTEYMYDRLSYDDFKKWALMSGMSESDFDSEVIYHEPAKAY